MVEQAAQLVVARPEAGHAVGMWFRPLVAVRLKSRHIATLVELVNFCNARGGTWWRAVPRIGAGRARSIVSWLRRHEATIGLRVEADVDARDPLRRAGQSDCRGGRPSNRARTARTHDLRSSAVRERGREPSCPIPLHPCLERPRSGAS
ncbi:TPA: hypothetical protein U2L33_002852 [Burkholderia cenocepacia]|nr:hypothetical protein [Burkholderia cenocepacia]